MSYLASASPSPASAGQCGLPRRAGRSWFPIWPTRFRQDALAAGGGDDRVGLRDGPGTHVAGQPDQRGRDGALLGQRAAPTRLPSWHRWHWLRHCLLIQAKRALPLLCAVAPTLGGCQQSRTERADLARRFRRHAVNVRSWPMSGYPIIDSGRRVFAGYRSGAQSDRGARAVTAVSQLPWIDPWRHGRSRGRATRPASAARLGSAHQVVVPWPGE